MRDPIGLWTRCRSASSRGLARALGWSFSASRAIVRPGLLVALLVVLAPVCLVLTQSRLHASGNTPPVVPPPRPFAIPASAPLELQEPAPQSAYQPLAIEPAATSGTWTPLNNQPSFGPASVFLLTDGRVLAQDGNLTAVAWWTLTPDNTGSYINGTWKRVASPPACPNGYPGASADTVYSPLYYGSAVLADGRFVIIGGEYDYDYDYVEKNGSGEVWTDQAAIYDPVANSWTCIAPPSGWSQIGDAQSVVLPDGTFMVADPFDNAVATLNANSNPPTFNSPFTPNGKTADNQNDEEGWTLLPNGMVLTLEVWNSNDGTETPALAYNSATEAWSSAGIAPDPLVLISQGGTFYYEIGPTLLRPDGTVFASGATGHNDIYNTSNGAWSSGPSFPTVSGQQLEAADAPAALLPDGNVLIAASPVFTSPTEYFEFDGTSLTQVAAPPNAPFDTSFQERLLVLPTAQVLLTDESGEVEIYTPAGTPNSSWAPTITGSPAQISPGGTNYQLSGTQFNGLSQAVAYGDDYQAATNYPLVRVTNNATGHVFYAHTHGHSTMAVGTGSTPVSTEFDVPAGIEPGPSTLIVVANGIESSSVAVNVAGPTPTPTPTSTATATATATATRTATATATLTSTATRTATVTATSTRTATATATATATPTGTTTATATPTATLTAMATATQTATASPTATATPTGTTTATATATPTATLTATATATQTATASPTATATPTTTATATATASATPTATATATQTATATATASATPTSTASATVTATQTATATATQTATATATTTPTPTSTSTSTATATPTSTTTTTATATATQTATATATNTATATSTATATPTATATATATNTSTATATATLTATPTATPTTSISVPPSLAMGSSPVGDTVTKNLTVKNTGTNPLFIGIVTSNDPEFAETGSTCPGGGLAHLATCTIAIGFTPSTLGSHSATLSVNDNTSTSPQHVAVGGTGSTDMTVLPVSFSFGNTKFGVKVVKSVAVSNKQTKAVSLSRSISGPNAADFTITGGSCSATLAANTACSIQVTFTPGVLGSESATLTVSDSPDPASPYSVSFNVAGTIPETVAPITLSYGTVSQSSSKTLKTTVTNKSPFAISIGSAVSGANAADFTITGGTCGPTLAGNSTCTIGVKFKPTTAAAESATLAVSVPQDPTSPHNVSLTGTGS
jgi:hypothetical protein